MKRMLKNFGYESTTEDLDDMEKKIRSTIDIQVKLFNCNFHLQVGWGIYMDEKPAFVKSCDYLLTSFTVSKSYISVPPKLLAASVVMGAKLLFILKTAKSTDQDEIQAFFNKGLINLGLSSAEVIQLTDTLLINFIQKKCSEATYKYRQRG